MNKLKEKFSTGVSFIGTFNKLPTTGNLGDCCIVDGDVYIYGFSWEKLGGLMINPIIDKSFIKNETLYLT